MVGVEAVHVLEDEAAGHFEAHLLFDPCLLVELIGEQGCPGHVDVVVQARVADVAGVEDLLHNKLCKGIPYPFMVALRREYKRVTIFEGLEFLQPRSMVTHISVEYQPRNDMPRLLLIPSPHHKINSRIFLQDPPKCPNMHVFEHRLIIANPRKFRS